jgi:hypothetical protein
MICVLRIGGYGLELGISKHIRDRPYRMEIDDKSYETAYFDVADVDNKLDLVDGIRCFARQNKEAFDFGKSNPDLVKRMDFDVGVNMGPAYAKSLTFDKELIAELSNLGVSLTVSIYETE